EYSKSHQPAHFFRRHQPGKQYGAVLFAGTTRGTAELDIQPATGDIWRWTHVHGTEPRQAGGFAFAERIVGAESGTPDSACQPGKRCDKIGRASCRERVE